VLVRLIFSWDMTQASTPAAGGESDDVAVPGDDVPDDAVPVGFVLAHAVMTSPHVVTAMTPRVILRQRAVALLNVR
jgi:hypothetical protein